MAENWNYLVKGGGTGFDINCRNIYIGYQAPDMCVPVEKEKKPLSILQFVIKGKGLFAIDGFSVVPIEKGNVFYLPKGVGVSYLADQHEPYEYYYLAIDTPDNDKFFEQLGFSVENPILKADDPALFDLLKELYRTSEQTSIPGIFRSISLLYELFSRLSEIGGEKDQLAATKNAYVEKALIFINNNYPSDINVNKIAQVVNLDRSYFTTLFTAHMGMSPLRYLTELRVSQACKLLAMNYTCTEVSDMTGFSSATKFGIHFKRVMKMTPYEYKKYLRQNHGGKDEKD